MTVNEKIVAAAREMAKEGYKYRYVNPGFGPTDWCCVTAVSYWIYKGMGLKWNMGTSNQTYGYFWSPRHGAGYDNMLIRLGYKKHLYSTIGRNGLRAGDVLMANDHSVLMTTPNKFCESYPSSPSIREVNFYAHNWLYVFRLPEKRENWMNDFIKAVEGDIILKRGCPYKKVTALWQEYLSDEKLYTGSIDGDFGAMTEKATKAWQKANGLVVDGWIGAIGFRKWLGEE